LFSLIIGEGHGEVRYEPQNVVFEVAEADLQIVSRTAWLPGASAGSFRQRRLLFVDSGIRGTILAWPGATAVAASME
jgi:hypothetical protein